MFTKGIGQEAARAQVTMEGQGDLAEKIFHFTAIVG
jgi:hypothetical protein